MIRRSIIGLAIAACFVVASWSCVVAATRTWTGANTNWNDAANWGGAIPGDGDAVVVPDTATKASMPSGEYPAAGSYLSFEVQPGAIVYCLGNTNAINAASGGTADIKHGTGVAIHCQSALIEGTLNADFLGFPGGLNYAIYRGPGNGTYWSASHGGGKQRTYGSVTNPTALGSGNDSAMPGGGAIKIAVTNTLTLNGTITAKGKGDPSGAGAGGSVWLVCDQFAGTGTVSALGGASSGAVYGGYNRSGGGGRIAIECRTNAFQGLINVAGGCGTGVGFGPAGMVEAGTLWFPQWLVGKQGSPGNPVDITLMGSQVGMQFWFPDSSVTHYWNVYMTNSWLELYGGSVVVSNLLMTNSCFWVFNTNNAAMSNLVVNGAIYMSNCTSYLPSYGVYDLAGDFTMTDTNTIIYAVGDTNAVNEDSGGVVGTPHGAGVSILCRNAVLAGQINAEGKGFPQGQGPGKGPFDIGWYAGGSYGGEGGKQGAGTATLPYGSLTRPTALGSGGGSGYALGGGAVKVKATGDMTFDGLINVKGKKGNNGGSGGSVWLQAGGTFGGSGAIQADGGEGGAVYGGGGGGRIAIEYGTWNYTGTNSVNWGATTVNFPPRTGTVFLCQSPWLGTTTTNGVDGRQLDTFFNVSSNNIRIARSISRFDTSMEWTDLSTDTSGSVIVSNDAIYTINGLLPEFKYSVCVDGVSQFAEGLTTSVDGSLVFTNALEASHKFFISPYAHGTVFKIR